MVVSNHPFGVIDGLILTHTIISKYNDFRAIGNDAFLLIPNLRPYITKVNVYGKSSREEINQLNSLYESDLAITNFPAGEVSRIYHWKISDCNWQKSFIGKSLSSRRDIVPIHFKGRNSILFYTIFILRRMFGIKLNIELMLLPREMLKKRNKKVTVKILKPIGWKLLEKAPPYEMAQKIKNYVYTEKYNF
jgi:putative hemolysin